MNTVWTGNNELRIIKQYVGLTILNVLMVFKNKFLSKC